MDELNLIHLEGEESAFGLIDFSSENDSLFLDDESSPQRHSLPSENWKDTQNIDLFNSMNDVKEAEAEEFTVESIDQIKQSPDVSDSSVPDRLRGKGNCNLRKSLAWDSAFFTSAGVLDPEELSGMIGGAERKKNQVLTKIIEDVAVSTGSISSLGSESLTADNFEADLCEDIKASTQKSSKKLVVPGYKEASKKSFTLPSSRKMGPTTQNQVKSKTATKKPDVMPKAIPKQNLRAQGPVRTTKQDSSLSEVTKSVKVADSTTKLPQIGRSITIKRDSFGAIQGNKNESDKLKTNIGASSKVAQDIKVASINGARRILPKPALSSKSSSVSLSTLKTGPGDSCRSNLVGARRKVSEKQVKPPYGSTLKTPTKCAANTMSAFLKSSKKTCGVSPASSISEWSSVSSTSSSTTVNGGKLNASRTSFDNESFASDLEHTLDSHSQKTKVPSNSNRPGPFALAKPSGLRMPSPSIGFFDGVKSVHSTNGSSAQPQPHRSVKQLNTKAKIGKNLNTQKTAPDVISQDSDDGPTESNIYADVINPKQKESLLIVAKDGEKMDQVQGDILA